MSISDNDGSCCHLYVHKKSLKPIKFQVASKECHHKSEKVQKLRDHAPISERAAPSRTEPEPRFVGNKVGRNELLTLMYYML